MVDEVHPLAQELRRDVLVDVHVVHGELHVADRPSDEEIGAGAPAGDDGAVRQVEADGRRILAHALGKAVLPEHRRHRDLLAEQAEVVGDVAPDAAERRRHAAGVRVARDELPARNGADVHVHAADHDDIRRGAQQIAAPGDIAFFHEIRNVHRRAGTGDSRLVGQLLLGDHRVLADPFQQLALSLGHAAAS